MLIDIVMSRRRRRKRRRRKKRRDIFFLNMINNCLFVYFLVNMTIDNYQLVTWFSITFFFYNHSVVFSLSSQGSTRERFF